MQRLAINVYHFRWLTPQMTCVLQKSRTHMYRVVQPDAVLHVTMEGHVELSMTAAAWLVEQGPPAQNVS